MIISFAWTTPAFILRLKNTTRRDWSPKTIAAARKIMSEGGTFDAWSKAPHRGGKPLGKIRILEIIENEESCTIDRDEWEKEGFHVLEPLGAKIGGSTALDVWRYWIKENQVPQTVIRFTIDELNSYAESLIEPTQKELAAAGGTMSLSDAIRRRLYSRKAGGCL